jgi:hypothetical protein
MNSTLRVFARDRFTSEVAKAWKADGEGNTVEKRRHLKEADAIACYVLGAYSLADFAFVTGAA